MYQLAQVCLQIKYQFTFQIFNFSRAKCIILNQTDLLRYTYRHTLVYWVHPIIFSKHLVIELCMWQCYSVVRCLPLVACSIDILKPENQIMPSFSDLILMVT